MEADRRAIIVVLTVGIFLGVLLSLGVAVFTGPYEKVTEEQVSIQGEGGKMIDTLQLCSYRNIGVFQDKKRNVTCWIDLNKGGISCIPDHMLTP